MTNSRYAGNAGHGAVVALFVAFAAIFLFLPTSTASAFKVISETGSGAGSTHEPRGLAVDVETGRLFVADTGNNRIDVFDQNGNFERSFGWGVKNGANELQVCTTTCRAGLAGSGPGQFNRPAKIAVDNSPGSPSRHSVYVVDYGNSRIQKFDPEGSFLLSFGSQGEAEGQFATFGLLGRPVLIGVGPAGSVYVLDSIEPSGGVFNSRLQRFEPSGTLIPPQQKLKPSFSFAPGSFAIESGGDFYIGAGGVIRRYEVGNEDPIAEIDEPFEGEPVGDGLLGLAVDKDDNLFAVPTELGAKANIIKFSPAGSRLIRFGYGNFEQFSQDLAPYESSTGDIYASEPTLGGNGRGDRVLQLDLPDPEPLIFPTVPADAFTPERPACRAETLGNKSATLKAEVNPEGKATTYLFEYITQEDFDANFAETGDGFDGAKAVTSTAESAPIETELFTLHSASAEVTPLIPDTFYRCRLRAINADAPTGIVGEDGRFKTAPPLEVIDPPWAVSVGTSSATLAVEVDPFGIPATGYFQYVNDATYSADVQKAKEEGKSDEEAAEHGFDHAERVPATGEIDFGAGETPQPPAIGEARVNGLAAGTTYHYRIVATDELIAPQGKTVLGEARTFRTFAVGQGPLPDARGYEMVSPNDKNSAEVAVPSVAGGIFAEEKITRIQASSPSGEAMSYTSWTSFGDAEGAPSTSQYLSSRSATGWQTKNISPGGFMKNPIEPPYRGFTPDVGLGGFVITEPPLTPEAQPGSENLYLRNNQTGALQALTIEPPELQGEGLCTGYAGTSADGTRAFFAANARMADALPGKGFNLYEWSAAGGLKLVSVLPNGNPAPPVPSDSPVGTGTGFGAVGGNCTMDKGRVKHAVSEDGTVVFWSYKPAVTVTQVSPGTQTVAVGGSPDNFFTLTFKTSGPTSRIASNATAAIVRAQLESLSSIGAGNVEVTGSNPYTVTFKGPLTGTTDLLTGNAAPQLFARIDGSETKQIDVKQGGAGPSGGGRFAAATGDGSFVFFTAPGKLTPAPISQGPDLYRYDVENGTLTNLISPANSLLVPQVQGLIDVSEDGSYAYFVAGGVLSGEEENAAGQKAKAGENNLYLWHEGEANPRFIAILNDLDEKDWSATPALTTARVTPDGRHLAFLSVETEELSGFDNRIAPPAPPHCEVGPVVGAELEGDQHCAQVYLYDADADDLTCVSCNPSGSRPLGPTLLPVYSNPYEGPRYVSDDGSRVFFDSRDVLSSADLDRKRDAYEYEQLGTGTCAAQSPDFNPSSGGCLTLLSGGRGSDETYLLDASSSGRDVFFATRTPLVGWDQNENYDVYDAREGGGFPEPVQPDPPCQGEACLPPAGSAPPAAGSGTNSFVGPGNPKPKKPKKKKKHHKKKAKHHKKKGKGKGKSGKNQGQRRAGR